MVLLMHLYYFSPKNTSPVGKRTTLNHAGQALGLGGHQVARGPDPSPQGLQTWSPLGK